MGMDTRLRAVGHGDLERVHQATVQILEQVGLRFQSPEALEIFRRHGARCEGEAVFIPERMLDKALETAPKGFAWGARDPAKVIRVGQGQKRPTHVAINNGPIHIQDLDSGRRPGTLADLVKLYKLAQASPICDIVGQIPVEPSDLTHAARHLEIFHHLLRHTDKPLFGFVGDGTQVEDMFAMLEMAMGREHLFHEPVIAVSVNPLSPLRYDRAPCETLLAYARRRQPVMVLTCAMSGVSAPFRLLGTVVQQNAEILAGLVLTQLVNPGTPFVYSPGSARPNMRNAAYITGSPESNLINMVGIQLAREVYDLPCRAMAGLTDAKLVDCQAGYETMQNYFMLMLAGVHIINESVGLLDAILTVSYEKILIDEEMISRVFRVMQGLRTDEASLSLEAIREVGPGGSFLTHPSTLKHFREAWVPSVSHSGTHSEWVKQGSEDVVQRANRRVKEVLAGCPDCLLEPGVDKDLARFVAARR